jgi:hypothetical protein
MIRSHFLPASTITNPHNEPIQLLAFLVTQEAQLIYPEESVLMPVVWEDED